MSQPSPAALRALAAIEDAADAARAARKVAKRLDGKPARALRRRAHDAAAQLDLARAEVGADPKRARKDAEKTAARMRRATHDALSAHAARERRRAHATQERVRAAMTDSVPVVHAVRPPAPGLPAMVRPEALRRGQTWGSWVSIATMPEPGWSADRWATEKPPVSSDDELPK